MKKNGLPARGMTAIEVLAAMMLASLMLASVAGLLGALARQERELRRGDGEGHWLDQLAEQMLWDLRNSRHLIASRDGVRLVGFAARDFVTTRPTGRRATIDYYLVEAGGQRWLIRREEHPDEHTNDSYRTELVCRGIDHMKWGEAVIDQVAGAASGPKSQARSEPAVIPERVPIQLFASASAVPLFDKGLDAR